MGKQHIMLPECPNTVNLLIKNAFASNHNGKWNKYFRQKFRYINKMKFMQ